MLITELLMPGVGGAIATIRGLRGISQEELTKKALANIAEIEKRRNVEISQKTMSRIANNLKVPVSYIYLLAEEKTGPLMRNLQQMVLDHLVETSVKKR